MLSGIGIAEPGPPEPTPSQVTSTTEGTRYKGDTETILRLGILPQ
jgi:hypothetical protein